MPHATPEQTIQQQLRRETLRDAIISRLAAEPAQLNKWLRHQPDDPGTRRPEPDSIISVVNIHQGTATSLRTIETKRLRNGNTQWLNTQNLRCPTSDVQPQEATIFAIIAVPTIKAIALTDAGWNDCWNLQETLDDYEDNPALSPLLPIEIVTKAIEPLPHKVVITSPQNLVTIPYHTARRKHNQ